jgi:3-methylfumaryl-CoA hydratase
LSHDAAAPEDFSTWVGRTETLIERICPWRVAALAASLDLDTAPSVGAALPPAWQWLFFNPMAQRREIGHDGHPKRGGFLPPITLPRRMWAGSRISYHAPLIVGADVERTSEILRIESKTGKSGALVFVTVRHTFSAGGERRIEEEQDIVYRPAPPPGALPAPKTAAPGHADFSEQIVPDTTLLFRYSALTFNGHRIHYDQPYAVNEEGYPGLVVHGPLIATLLQGLAARSRPDKRLARFSFRGIQPLFAGNPFWIEAARVKDKADELTVWARTEDGALATQATAHFEEKGENR